MHGLWVGPVTVQSSGRDALVSARPDRWEQQRWLLRFVDSAAEASYRRENNQTDRLPLLIGVAAAAWVAAVPADVVLVKGPLVPVELVRVVTTGFLLVVLAATYRPWFAPRLQIFVSAATLFAAGATCIINLQAGVPNVWPFAAILAALLYTFVVVRLLIVYSLPVATLIVVGYLVTEAIRGASAGDWTVDVFYLSFFFVFGAGTGWVLERYSRAAFQREQLLAAERALSDRLLHSILPVPIAARLRLGPDVIAESADEVTALFADIVGFTALSETLPPTELVSLLDVLFSRIDARCEAHGIEKIKTIGDAYMAVAGIPLARSDHAVAIAELALEIQDIAGELSQAWPNGLTMRVGVHSGPVVAGVIGRRKPAYDLWGDTVNTAARMESHGTPGHITISDPTRCLLGDRYKCSEGAITHIKGKGEMRTYLLLGRDDGIRQGARSTTRLRE